MAAELECEEADSLVRSAIDAPFFPRGVLVSSPIFFCGRARVCVCLSLLAICGANFRVLSAKRQQRALMLDRSSRRNRPIDEQLSALVVVWSQPRAELRALHRVSILLKAPPLYSGRGKLDAHAHTECSFFSPSLSLSLYRAPFFSFRRNLSLSTTAQPRPRPRTSVGAKRAHLPRPFPRWSSRLTRRPDAHARARSRERRHHDGPTAPPRGAPPGCAIVTGPNQTTAAP